MDHVSIYNVNSYDQLANVQFSYPTGSSPSGVAISANGNYLFITNQGDNTIWSYDIYIDNNFSPPKIDLNYKESIATGSLPSGIAVATY